MPPDFSDRAAASISATLIFAPPAGFLAGAAPPFSPRAAARMSATDPFAAAAGLAAAGLGDAPGFALAGAFGDALAAALALGSSFGNGASITFR